MKQLVALAAVFVLAHHGAYAETSPEEAAADLTPLAVGHEELFEVIAGQDADAVVVNLWATWCMPCREEFPDFVKLGKAYAERRVRIVFVSLDFPENLDAVAAFLDDHGVTWPTYIKTAGGDEAFIDAFGERWSGALPATFVYDSTARERFFHEGKLSYRELEEQVSKLLEEEAE